MVQIPPTHYHTLKSHPSMSRFGSLPSRHTPTSQDLARSHTKHTNAVERVALRKFMSQVLTSHSSFPKPQSTAVTPVSTCSVSSLPSSTSSLDSSALSTPPTPSTSLEVDQDSLPEIKPKAGIFGNTTKSDELLDLILSALYRIYIEDFSQESDSYQSKPTMQPGNDVLSEAGAYKDNCDHCPDLIDGSSVSSGSSTPDSIPTPPPMSPEFNPEIACSTREGTPNYPTASCTAAAVKAKMQSVGRTQSLPNNYQYQAQTAAPRPVLEDKSLRWFVTELLRRSRASASVVQLALYYLKQARGPVGKLLNQKFKSARVSGEDGAGSEGDSPLVDPRKLVLAAIMLSTKILHDHAPNSRAWSRVCGLEPRQVSACESALGQALNWELVHMIVGPRDESVLFE